MDKKRIYITCLLILALMGIIPLSGCSAEASGEDAALLKEVTLGVWRNDEIIRPDTTDKCDRPTEDKYN